VVAATQASLGQSFFPVEWSAFEMGNGYNVNGVLFEPVDDSVGKALHDETAIRIVEEAGAVGELLEVEKKGTFRYSYD